MKFYPNKLWEELTHKVEQIIYKYHIPRNELLSNGAIYYLNGNDGTDFDWTMNDRTCEFAVAWKQTEMCFLKFSIFKNGRIMGYYYLTPNTMDGKQIDMGEIYEEEACEFARYMQKFFDDKDIYNEPVLKHTNFAPVDENDIYNYDIITEEEEEERRREEEEYEEAYEEEYGDEEDDDTMYGRRTRVARRPKAMKGKRIAHRRIVNNLSRRNEIVHLHGRRTARPKRVVKRPAVRKTHKVAKRPPFGVNVRRMF